MSAGWWALMIVVLLVYLFWGVITGPSSLDLHKEWLEEERERCEMWKSCVESLQQEVRALEHKIDMHNKVVYIARHYDCINLVWRSWSDHAIYEELENIAKQKQQKAS